MGSTVSVGENHGVHQDGGSAGLIRVILADTQAIFRAGLRKIFALEDDIRVVGVDVDGRSVPGLPLSADSICRFELVPGSVPIVVRAPDAAKRNGNAVRIGDCGDRVKMLGSGGRDGKGHASDRPGYAGPDRVEKLPIAGRPQDSYALNARMPDVCVHRILH